MTDLSLRNLTKSFGAVDVSRGVVQEIKSVDENFPRAEVEALGYHVETHGQKGFNGVAILSKLRFDEVNRGLPGDDEDEQARDRCSHCARGRPSPRR